MNIWKLTFQFWEIFDMYAWSTEWQNLHWMLILTTLIDYIIEKEPLVNRFISVPKDKGKDMLDILF